MKTTNVLGRRIVEIRQTKFYDHRIGHMSVCVDAIVLDNGVELYPTTNEMEDGYTTDFAVSKPRRARK